MRTLLPPGWPRPKGYANGISATGRTIYTAGVVGWNEQEAFVADTLPGQFEQVLHNILAILAVDGAGAANLVRMTCYVTSIDDYRASLPAIGTAWKAVVGPHFPAMALVEVSRLVEPAALIEIEAIAVVPE
ncbi:MAG: RidA family protein [Sphingomonas sp.]|nr:RidA family protein [Sphingomonas sp.]